MTEKEQAAAQVLAFLRSRMGIMSKPNREDHQKLAHEHNLTVDDLFAAALRYSYNA